MITDYALELLRKHEKNKASEKKEDAAKPPEKLEALRSEIKDAVEKAKSVEHRVEAVQQELKFKVDEPIENTAQEPVDSGASDEEIIAFNNCTLKM